MTAAAGATGSDQAVMVVIEEMVVRGAVTATGAGQEKRVGLRARAQKLSSHVTH